MGGPGSGRKPEGGAKSQLENMSLDEINRIHDEIKRMRGERVEPRQLSKSIQSKPMSDPKTVTKSSKSTQKKESSKQLQKPIQSKPIEKAKNNTMGKGKGFGIPVTSSSPAYKSLVDNSYNALSTSPEGREAVDFWMSDSYKIVGALVNKDKMTPEYEKTVQNLDGLLKSSVLTEDLITSSGVNKDLWDKIGKVGTEYTSPTFLSTTSSPEVSSNYASRTRKLYNNTRNANVKEEYVIEFHLPKGTPALATDKYLKNHKEYKGEKWPMGDKSGSEREVMIGRDLKYKVVDIQSIEDDLGMMKHKAVVEVIN